MAVAVLNNLPVFVANIDDEGCGMEKISLVDFPAVERDFLAFAGDKRPMMYSVADEDKHIVFGVVMRANFAIYRNDGGYEYYIVYQPDTIRRMAEKYLAENRQNAFNTMHEADSDIEGVNMVQWFIKDTEKGIAPAGFDDIEDGSLFGEFHIENEAVWKAIKDGTYKGFSLEGVFGIAPADKQDVDEVEAMSFFSQVTRDIKHLLSKNMNWEKIRARFAKWLAEFKAVSTDKGILAWDGEDDIAVGVAVFIEDEEGNRTPAEDGNYLTEDGTTIVVAEGKVAEIVPPAQAETEEPAEAETEQENAEEETPAEPEAPAEPDKVAELEKRIAELEDIVKSLVESVGVMASRQSRTPVAEPVHETFVAETPKPIKGDESANRILAKVKAHANK